MSTQNMVLNTGQQAIVNNDISKIFIWNNRFQPAQYTNGTGAQVTLPAGTLLGRITASGKVTPLASASVDGSQFPVGILNEEKIVGAGATIDLFMCVAGDVAQEKIVFQGGDTLDTVIDGKRLRDRLASDTLGINPIVTDELSRFDNQ